MSKPTIVMVGDMHGERPGLRASARACASNLFIEHCEAAVVTTIMVGPQVVGGADARATLARLQVVIAVLDPDNLNPARQLIAGYLFPCAERVARALAHERRRPDSGEVLGAMLGRLARRVERVARPMAYLTRSAAPPRSSSAHGVAVAI